MHCIIKLLTISLHPWDCYCLPYFTCGKISIKAVNEDMWKHIISKYLRQISITWIWVLISHESDCNLVIVECLNIKKQEMGNPNNSSWVQETWL